MKRKPSEDCDAFFAVANIFGVLFLIYEMRYEIYYVSETNERPQKRQVPGTGDWRRRQQRIRISRSQGHSIGLDTKTNTKEAIDEEAILLFPVHNGFSFHP